MLLLLLFVVPTLWTQQGSRDAHAPFRQDGTDIATRLSIALSRVQQPRAAHAVLLSSSGPPQFFKDLSAPTLSHALAQAALPSSGTEAGRREAAKLVLDALVLDISCAVAVVIPESRDLEARSSAHSLTYTRTALFQDAPRPESPIELVHQLVNLMHASLQNGSRVVDQTLWAAAQTIEAVEFLPGGAILRRRAETKTQQPAPRQQPSFEDVARTLNPVTDKVSRHGYAGIYDSHLQTLRARAHTGGRVIPAAA